MLQKSASLVMFFLMIVPVLAAVSGAPPAETVGPFASEVDMGASLEESTMTIRLEYQRPSIDVGPFGTEARIQGLPQDERPAFRRLPVDTRRFEFEIGSRIDGIRISDAYTGRLTISHPISFNPEGVPRGEPGPGRSGEKDPDQHLEWSVHTGLHEGGRYALLIVRVHPVLVADGKLEYLRSGSLEIDHSLDPEKSHSSVFSNSSYDMLVLCPGVFRSRVDQYAEYRNQTGIRTIPVSLEEIRSDQYWELDGADAQEEIKKFIYNATLEWGIEYVMLAGDVDRIPARHILVLDGNDDSGAANRDGAFVPADLYYSDIFQGGTLDLSTWNSYTSGEHRYLWGEYDGSMLDSPDLYPDVHVGRVPASTEEELDLMLDKISVYELGAKGSDWVYNATLGGTDSYEGEATPEGEFLCDHVSGDHLGDYNVSKYYESHGNLGNITEELENHTGFALLSDHGDYSGWGYTSNYSGVLRLSTASGMDNGGELPLIIIDACLTHGFDNENASDENKGKDPIYNQWYYPPGSVHRGRDSLGEWLHLAERGGAVATFGSTRVSYGSPGATYPNSLSGYMAAHLTMAMSSGIGTPGGMLSQAFTDYLDDNGASTHEDYKTVTQFVLLGDPSLTIGGVDPLSLDIDLESDKVHVAPGEERSIGFDIRNQGGMNASLDLVTEIIDNGAVVWTSNISKNSTVLEPGENISGEISIYAPLDARAFQTRTIRLSVDSLLLLEPLTVDLEAEALRTRGVEVGQTPEGFRVEQGAEVNGYFHVRNTGNGDEELLLDLSEVPSGWGHYIEGTKLEVGPFQTLDVPFMLSIPDRYVAGIYELELRVRSNLTDVDLNHSFLVEVEVEKGLLLELPEPRVNLSVGSPLDVPVELRNPGNSLINASLDVSLSGLEDWNIGFSSEHLEVPAFSVRSTTLVLRGPLDIAPGSYIVRITASNGSVSDSVELEVLVQERYAFDVRIGTDHLVMDRETTGYTSLNISNMGNIYDQYFISTADLSDDNITITLEDQVVSVQSGSHRTVGIEVSVGDPLNGTYGLDLLVSSISDTLNLSIPFRITVRKDHNFSVLKADTEMEGLPGERVTFSVRLVNEGNTNDTMRAAVEPPEGWAAINDSLEAGIGPKGSRAFEFELVIPEDEIAGRRTFRLSTYSRGMNSTKSTTLSVKVLEVYGLHISMELQESPLKLRAGRLHTIELYVENMGNSAEFVELGFSASRVVRSWISLSTSELTNLMPGDNRTVTILIDVPVNITPGNYDLSIFVSSSGDIEAYKEEVPLVIEEEAGPGIFSGIDPVPVIITIIIGLVVIIGIAVVVVRLYRKNTGVDLEEAGMEWEEDEWEDFE